ncbi:unnamed protein product, partial [Thlaspi arvense]
FQRAEMWRQLLIVTCSTYNAASAIWLLRETSRHIAKKRALRYWKGGSSEDRISALPDDLLVHILTFVPTKKVGATMLLSKRWRTTWTMVPQLDYRDIDYGAIRKSFVGGLIARLFGKSDEQRYRSIWPLLDGSLQAHKAPVLEKLTIVLLGPRCPVDADMGKWIANAVERKVRELVFRLSWSAGPTTGLPKSLYTCDTLYTLCLRDKILVDVPSPACLPSLQRLYLYSVVYKDEDSHVRLLSSCPILKALYVRRHRQDNVTKFNIKVPSLECLLYDFLEFVGHDGSLVIDSPALKRVLIRDYSGDSCLIENKPRFDKATIHVANSYPNSKFIKSLSSLMHLELLLVTPAVVCCNAINFSKLIDCRIQLQNDLDWLEPLMLLLHNSPNLKLLFIHQDQPSSVPKCLSAHLEIFEWKQYGGRSEEKQVVEYIFANSKCLKKAGISMKSKLRGKKKMMKELESMPRVSISSQLLFSTQLGSLTIKMAN